MIKLTDHGVYLSADGKILDPQLIPAAELSAQLQRSGLSDSSAARRRTLASRVMSAHNLSNEEGKLRIRFDALASHDITYVGIILSARASGMEKFPLPYVLTNCHNSLCAVGGTINEDDHVFGLSAAKKYGGIYVPAHLAVIHQYMREMLAACGSMILGSDSHTRYGCFGTMGVGEGGPELVKQLLEHTYDVNTPEVVLVFLDGAPKPGVGPHDVAIALVKAVFQNGFAKNKVLEFAGPGIQNLPMDFRAGIDVMTTETTCLSSIWQTDETVKAYFENHGRPEAYREMKAEPLAYYDSLIHIDLSTIQPMIALPFHPSNAYTIHELLQNPRDILRGVELRAQEQFGSQVSLDLVSKVQDGRVLTDQGIIAGCAGGMFDNICAAADILDAGGPGSDYFTMSVYPSSAPVQKALADNGVLSRLLSAGVINKTAFCGPCFGAGDVPANDALSIRHTTRNFPNREGSKPDQRQLSCVALMDARSIAATARAGGYLTAATDLELTYHAYPYHFDGAIYHRRVFDGRGHADPQLELRFGPNITDWPAVHPLSQNVLLQLAAVIQDPVTTTDELIPSGETSSFRSNPLKLAEFTLSRREPQYVPRAKAIHALETQRRTGAQVPEMLNALSKISPDPAALLGSTSLGSAIFATKPGDGSAREQAASCQKVLGGSANIAREYATKRYRSNCINWGILPFTIAAGTPFDFQPGDYIYVPDIRAAIADGQETIPAKVISAAGVTDLTLYCKGLTDDEKQIILDGCLMNTYAAKNRKEK